MKRILTCLMFLGIGFLPIYANFIYKDPTPDPTSIPTLVFTTLIGVGIMLMGLWILIADLPKDSGNYSDPMEDKKKIYDKDGDIVGYVDKDE